MTVLTFVAHLRFLGITLSPLPDGRIKVHDARDALTPELVDLIRQHKPAVHAVLIELAERAAIAEFCGGLSPEDAEALAWHCVIADAHGSGCAACGYREPVLTE